MPHKSMAWKIILTYAFVVRILHSVSSTSHFRANKVLNEESVMVEAESQPTCRRNDVCGFMQVNEKGTSQESYCSCPGNSPCPITWDVNDGKTILQGSDQYKFCSKAPALLECKPDQLAYRSRMIFHNPTKNILCNSEIMHCRCPRWHQYVVAQHVLDQPTNNTEAITISYACVKLPFCRRGDTCKTIIETGNQFLVEVNCRCFGRQHCPTFENHSSETWNFGGARETQLHCKY